MGKGKGRGSGVCGYARECRVQEWKEECKDTVLEAFSVCISNSPVKRCMSS